MASIENLKNRAIKFLKITKINQQKIFENKKNNKEEEE